MGKEENRLPFSIISKGKKIKQFKKLGWKYYLLVVVFFAMLGGVIAYYNHDDSWNNLSSNAKEQAANEELILESISESEIEQQEKSNKSTPSTNVSKNSEPKKEKLEENDKQKQPTGVVPQMSSEPISNQLNNLVMPVQGEIISNNEWYKDEVLDAWKYNPGINIKAEIGSEIKAAQEGTIKEIIKDDYQGITVIIKHNEVYKTLYANLEKATVEVGQQVNKGQIVGELGDSGISASESKLHFEILKNNKTVKPLKYLR
ncbi:MAG: peptidoglycan DD-metalloendopeptidase family protein [Bacillota bacterium]